MKIKANSMIEFALTAPIFLALLVGIMDFGVITYNKAVVTNASREAARYGVVFRAPSYASTSQVQTYAQNYVAGKLITFSSTAGLVTVNVTPTVTPPVFGAKLTVQVNYVYTDLLLHKIIGTGGTQTITASTTMTYE